MRASAQRTSRWATRRSMKPSAAGATLKSTIDLRPDYHRREDRIESHIQLCWLALLILRVAETETADTWRNLRNELDRMHLVTLATSEGTVAQRTELTHRQRQILAAPRAACRRASTTSAPAASTPGTAAAGCTRAQPARDKSPAHTHLTGVFVCLASAELRGMDGGNYHAGDVPAGVYLRSCAPARPKWTERLRGREGRRGPKVRRLLVDAHPLHRRGLRLRRSRALFATRGSAVCIRSWPAARASGEALHIRLRGAAANTQRGMLRFCEELIAWGRPRGSAREKSAARRQRLLEQPGYEPPRSGRAGRTRSPSAWSRRSQCAKSVLGLPRAAGPSSRGLPRAR